MTYRDFLKEVATKSKDTERPLSMEDVRMCIELSRDTIKEILKNEDSLIIRDFVKFETKVQKGRTIKMVNSDKLANIPDAVVAKVALSENFKNEIKKAL